MKYWETEKRTQIGVAQKITDLPRHRVGYQGIDLLLWWGRRVFRILWA